MMILGMLLARMASPDTSLLYLILVVVAAGIGMGTQTPSLMLTVQQSVNQADVGVATSTQMLARTLGGALGVTVMGAVMIASMSRALGSLPSGLLPLGGSLRELLEPGLMSTLSPGAQRAMLCGPLRRAERRLHAGSRHCLLQPPSELDHSPNSATDTLLSPLALCSDDPVGASFLLNFSTLSSASLTVPVFKTAKR